MKFDWHCGFKGDVCILFAQLGAFSFGELKTFSFDHVWYVTYTLSDLELIKGHCG